MSSPTFLQVPVFFRFRRRVALFACAMLVFGVARAEAQFFSVNYDTPTLDKWMYPFASGGGGGRTSAPTFGAIGNIDGFDDRDGQFLTGFTLNGLPSGAGASNYIVTSVKLTLSLNTQAADSVIYDNTYDPISSYGPNGEAVGGDPGRPMELYGVGYRNGFTATSLQENSPFVPTGGNAQMRGVRNFYASDYSAGVARDVSNNVGGLSGSTPFDPTPFAIGQVAAADLNGDNTMKDGALISFTLNLSNPDVLSYVQNGLNVGRLNLLATSLSEAVNGQTGGHPEYDAKELGLAGTPGRLELQVTVVPEPGTLGSLLVGAAVLGLHRRRQRALPSL